jgi:hypothetical protein
VGKTLGLLRRADVLVPPPCLFQQARSRRVIAEHGGQFGAPLGERGGKCLRARALDQCCSTGEHGFGGSASRWCTKTDDEALVSEAFQAAVAKARELGWIV